jgi:hypothetical protein
MARRIRCYQTAEAAWAALEAARQAVAHLRTARGICADFGAAKAKQAISRAVKSAEGAERHAERIYMSRYYDERREEGTA